MTNRPDLRITAKWLATVADANTAHAVIEELTHMHMTPGAGPGAASLGSGDGDTITRRELRELARELLIIATGGDA